MGQGIEGIERSRDQEAPQDLLNQAEAVRPGVAIGLRIQKRWPAWPETRAWSDCGWRGPPPAEKDTPGDAPKRAIPVKTLV